MRKGRWKQDACIPLSQKLDDDKEVMTGCAIQAIANKGLPTERERFKMRAIWLAVESMPVKKETISRRADVAS